MFDSLMIQKFCLDSFVVDNISQYLLRDLKSLAIHIEVLHDLIYIWFHQASKAFH